MPNFWVLFPFVYQLSHFPWSYYVLSHLYVFLQAFLDTHSAWKNLTHPLRHSGNVPLADVFPLLL